jgi:hypothetical protein
MRSLQVGLAARERGHLTCATLVKLRGDSNQARQPATSCDVRNNPIATSFRQTQQQSHRQRGPTATAGPDSGRVMPHDFVSVARVQKMKHGMATVGCLRLTTTHGCGVIDRSALGSEALA